MGADSSHSEGMFRIYGYRPDRKQTVLDTQNVLQYGKPVSYR